MFYINIYIYISQQPPKYILYVIFIFHTQFLKYVFYTSSTSQFRLAMFQVLSNHM